MNGLIDRENMVKRLLALPAEIYEAEKKVAAAYEIQKTAQSLLKDLEDSLLFAVKEDGTKFISGKNEAERSAQIREHTKSSRETLQSLEDAVITSRLELSKLQNELASMKAIARLLEVSA
ncbi:hypothetical protein [Acetonema longum]|uniref:Uncharacterized protein n=1 Tax=Acetonema longum DSM 6540 TaxID=1009370 RepID=F7NKF2_9FIRM|nr:hypothetical protein [Acetonema longum]EGO63593.1 hypothetical protein ALO_12826 [Acetonema longum DSM 6540]